MTWVVLGIVCAVVAVCGVLAVRAIRNAGRRIGGWQLRYLDVRTRFLPPGPRRDADRLRYRLLAELRATREMLQTAPQGVVFRADATALLQELASTAAALDRELTAIQRFLDPAQQRTALTTVIPQVRQLIETTYSARHTILRTAVEDRARQLTALRDNVATQAAALENYRRDGRELSL
jgi:hypothetical protein